MFQRIEKSEQFNPTWRGVWLNEVYLIRRTISEAIRENAYYLDGTIMDYGCGSRPYEKFFSDSKYIGVDVLISGHPPELKTADVYFDGNTLPFDDGFFDGIIASEVFEHVMDLDSCLAELHRVTKPGGRLLVTCPFVWPLHEEPYDFARYTPYALTQELRKCGFKILKIEQHGSPREVIGQLFIAEILPRILNPFRRISILHRWTQRILAGLTVIFCRVGSSSLPRSRRLYLTNLVVAEKL